MHLGFLFIMVAHLQSAYGGAKEAMMVQPGSTVTFPDGTRVVFDRFDAVYSPMGMPTAFSAHLQVQGAAASRNTTISPNHPFLHQGHGVYLKEVAPPPQQAALVELHREPGAAMALAGGLVFTIANIILLARRRVRG
jgi:cytochrome c biogenesis protein ResB